MLPVLKCFPNADLRNLKDGGLSGAFHGMFYTESHCPLNKGAVGDRTFVSPWSIFLLFQLSGFNFDGRIVFFIVPFINIP